MKAPALIGYSGPFKVLNFDEKTRVVMLDKHTPITLKPSAKDVPKIGYNYIFKMLDNKSASAVGLLTVDMIIRTDNEVLLIRRKNDPFAGRWALPGGFVDPGETPEKAAIRELREETGLTLVASRSKVNYEGKYDQRGRDPRMELCVSLVHSCYLSENDKRNVAAGDDAAAVRWVPLDQLKSKLFAFDHKKILQRAGLLSTNRKRSV